VSRIALGLLSGTDPSFATDADRVALAPLLAALRPAISGLAQHPDPSVRAAAFALLGASDAGEASAALLAALEDGDEQVQSKALDRIGPADNSNPRALERVAETATHDGRWWVRLRAVAALGRVGSERAATWLLPVLASDSYAYVREAAAAALGATRSAHAVSALSTALARDPEPRVRVAAARALQRTGGQEARQALQRMDPQTKAAVQANEQRN
jgi:HEAT repeat protein